MGDEIIYEFLEDKKLRKIAEINIEKLKLGVKLGKEIKTPTPLEARYHIKFSREIKSKIGAIDENAYLQ